MPGSVRRDQVTITQDGQRSPLSAPAQLVEGMRQVVRVFDLQDVRAIGIAEARALVVGPALLHDGEVEPDLRAGGRQLEGVLLGDPQYRSEERSVGNKGVSTCRD